MGTWNRRHGARREQMHWFRTRTLSRIALAAGAAALLAGCGDDPGPVPDGCTEGPAPLLRALRSAPGQVRLGDARLSDCLQKGADSGQLELVGTSFVDAASLLSPPARRRPNGGAALELGYLVAAAQRGGSRTQGVHDELLRRLDQELTGVDTRSPAYLRGKLAGQTAG
jgi:Tfp pilus assembly protein FimV